MSFPEKGKFFPEEGGNGEHESDGVNGDFAAVIRSSLKRSLGNSRAGIKTVTTWTGANKKTVKNWFQGKYGPSGKHLVDLIRHSDDVLETFLQMAGRQDLMVAMKLATAEHAIAELLVAVRRLSADE
jgi:hypothetical protein